MVAAHSFDLDAAAAVGYRTAFVHRPSEWGPVPDPIERAQPNADIVAESFGELTDQLSG